jgi:hypothetical protein
MADPAPSRRRFQFRLRTLLIVVTVLAVPCAFVHFKRSEDQRREAAKAAALERVKELGGSVTWLIASKNEQPELIVLPRSTIVKDRQAIQSAFPGVPLFPRKADGGTIFDLDAWSESAAQAK